MIIGIAGITKSGKSHLANALQENLNWPILGFGSYVRHFAKSNHLGTSFTDLQSIGQSMIDEDPASFLSDVFEFGGHRFSDNLILDGLRHMEVANEIRNRAFPEKMLIVLVKLDPPTLADRHSAVNLVTEEILRGPAEQQVQNIFNHESDIAISGDAPVSQSVSKILQLLQL